ncbi:hypothetical protein ACQZV8_20220 [Magnetococcales bacterium HHB-1]
MSIWSFPETASESSYNQTVVLKSKWEMIRWMLSMREALEAQNSSNIPVSEKRD